MYCHDNSGYQLTDETKGILECCIFFMRVVCCCVAWLLIVSVLSCDLSAIVMLANQNRVCTLTEFLLTSCIVERTRALRLIKQTCYKIVYFMRFKKTKPNKGRQITMRNNAVFLQ